MLTSTDETLPVRVPPIKTQGIKTKLIPWIGDAIPDGFSGRWVEPFMGSCVVALNLAPGDVLLSDTNPHLVRFYQAVQSRAITPERVHDYLTHEGVTLSKKGAEHYYDIRTRFNQNHCPLDFLFLNRTGFNGLIRFNRSGGLNTPFGHSPNRLINERHVSRIVEQVSAVVEFFDGREVQIECQPFEATIANAEKEDLVYADPPYLGLSSDYFNGWDIADEKRLFTALNERTGAFLLSTWLSNKAGENEAVAAFWAPFERLTREHRYLIGGKEMNRRSVIEALFIKRAIAKKDKHG